LVANAAVILDVKVEFRKVKVRAKGSDSVVVSDGDLWFVYERDAVVVERVR